MDWFPVVSQVKSLVQGISGDAEGARATQANFSRQCPVVSQIRSLVEVSLGDAEAARNTQKEFGGTMSNVVNGIPAVGHVKGGIHYVCGDYEGGDRALKSSSRTTGVLAGGAGGFLVAGPVGAVAGGVSAGVAMDGVTTVVESKVKGKYCPNGSLAAIEHCIQEEGAKKSGAIFDALCIPVGDALAGYAAGRAAGGKALLAEENLQAQAKQSKTVANAVAKARQPAPPAVIYEGSMSDAAFGNQPTTAGGGGSAGAGPIAPVPRSSAPGSASVPASTVSSSGTSTRFTEISRVSSSVPSVTYSDGVAPFINKQQQITVYRGCTDLVENPLQAPPRGAGNGGATLGQGSYWSESLAQAQQYARDAGGSVWELQFSLDELVGQDLSIYVSTVDDLGANNLGPRGPVLHYYDAVSSLHGGPRQWRFNAAACQRIVSSPQRL